jgi:hypothetical protein
VRTCMAVAVRPAGQGAERIRRSPASEYAGRKSCPHSGTQYASSTAARARATSRAPRPRRCPASGRSHLTAAPACARAPHGARGRARSRRGARRAARGRRASRADRGSGRGAARSAAWAPAGAGMAPGSTPTSRTRSGARPGRRARRAATTACSCSDRPWIRGVALPPPGCRRQDPRAPAVGSRRPGLGRACACADAFRVPESSTPIQV